MYPESEVIKNDGKSYGGWQTYTMTPAQLAQRMCVAKGCSEPGYIQSLIWPPEDKEPPMLRILCRRHLVRVSLAISVVLGDPSPVGEVTNLLLRMGEQNIPIVDVLREKPYAEPVMPEDFRCLACGGNGQLMAETQGMFSGKRWIHTCGETVRERKEADQ